MKVILLVDDKKFGKKNDIIEVADSYARNVLIPKKIVESADNANLNRLKNRIAKEKHEYETALNAANTLKSKLSELENIKFVVNTTSSGKMFGSITNKGISDRLNAIGFSIDKKDVVLKNNITTTGNFTATIKLFSGITVDIPIIVVNSN